MTYQLVPAAADDQTWLEQLRRVVYQELFHATFGGWDESRHLRQFAECWARGGISIIVADEAPVGMIQVVEEAGTVQIAEIQVDPHHQNRGLGTRVLTDVIAGAHARRRTVRLSVALRNERALRLYERLGFQMVARDATHQHLARAPQA